ncbi:MAG: hypothetical protein JNM21_16380 [Taibaiella sp.]|nr:hypothetical protein [Taibaiella sp.]
MGQAELFDQLGTLFDEILSKKTVISSKYFSDCALTLSSGWNFINKKAISPDREIAASMFLNKTILGS